MSRAPSLYVGRSGQEQLTTLWVSKESKPDTRPFCGARVKTGAWLASLRSQVLIRPSAFTENESSFQIVLIILYYTVFENPQRHIYLSVVAMTLVCSGSFR